MEYTEVYPIELRSGYTDNGICVMMLYEPRANLDVPVMLGEHEANVIMVEKEGVVPARPQTHELLCNIIESFNLVIKKITIDNMVEGIFYATLHLSDGFVLKELDCRVSDAIIIALHQSIPILMNSEILKEVGFPSQSMVTVQTAHDEQNPLEALTLEELEQLLLTCERNEDYEQAAILNQRIEQLRQNNH